MVVWGVKAAGFEMVHERDMALDANQVRHEFKFISQNVLIKRFWKVNSTTESSTSCLLLLIKTIS